jgi:ComF family protein
MLMQWIGGWFARMPSRCAVCHAWPAQAVCEDCIERFAQPRHRCKTCALTLPQGVLRCGTCLRTPPPLDACLAAVSYEYPWSGLIHRFKFGQRPAQAQGLALLLRSTPWVEPALEQADWVLPLPLAPQRLQERGYNQSLELARALAPDKTHAHLLLRVRETPAQSTLKRRERLANMADAFAVAPLQHGMLKQRRLVLVDDVMTSGASLYAAARVLRQAGAAHITAVVLARTE